MTRLFAIAAVLVGLLFGDLRPVPVGPFVLLAALAAASALLLRHSRWGVACLLAAGFAAGAARAAAVPDPFAPAWLVPYRDLPTRVVGVAHDAPVRSAAGTSAHLLLDVQAAAPAGRTPLRPESPTGPGAPVTILVLADPDRLAAVAPGDTLTLEGPLRIDPGARGPTLLFPRLVDRAPAPLENLPAQLAGLRLRADRGIHASLPEPHASLAAGVLLGGAGELDPDFRRQLQRSGLAHIVAIDGYKQVLVAASLGGVARALLGFRTAIGLTFAGVVAYTLLTGAHASAVRAALMVGLASLAALLGRPADSLHGLLVAALLMGLQNPRILLDLGLQLSVTATLGLILLWPRLRRYTRGLPGWLAEPAGLTAAVTLATLPLMLSTFQSVSLVSPLAHVLAVPLLPLVLGGTAGLALVSPSPALAALLAPLAWAPTALLVEIVRWTGSLPGAALETGRPPPALVALASLALLGWGLWRLPELAGLRRRWRDAGYAHPRALRRGVLGLGALGLLLVGLALRPDPTVRLEPLEVAGGQAVLIRGPTGHTTLVVDGRVDPTGLAAAVAAALPLWAHELDVAVAADGVAARSLSATLARYPARATVTLASATPAPTQIELGDGAVLDVREPRRPVLRYGAEQYRLLDTPRLTSVLTISATRRGSADSP